MNKSFVFTAITALLPTFLHAGEVHEWGTFTTVSGSDGRLLSGLHVEEEHLPSFVYSHGGMLYNRSNIRMMDLGQKFVQNGKPYSGYYKGIALNSVKNVTVKMETPVLYFYGDKRESYNVKIDFNGGTISQWYPQRKSGDVLPPTELNRSLAAKNPLDFSKPFKGFIEWDVDVIPRAEADEALTFKPNQTLSWEYPRVPHANMLKVGKEHENYLFYRGVGNFAQPVKFTVDAQETLAIQNTSKEVIPFAFAYEKLGSKVRYKTFTGGVEPGKKVEVAENDWKECDLKTWRVEVFQQIRDGLLEQGLNLAEADGMVKTWWNSYFEHHGLRVFWVVPQGELDKVLPIKITPKPEKLVRVIVGRSDILRRSFERKLESQLASGSFSYDISGDRFFEPYKHRLRQLVQTPYYLPFTEQALRGKHLVREITEGDKKTRLDVSFQEDKVMMGKTSLGAWQITKEGMLKIGASVYRLDKKANVLHLMNGGANKKPERIQLPLVLDKAI